MFFVGQSKVLFFGSGICETTFFIVDFSKRISRLNVTFLGHFFPIGRVNSHKQVTVGKTIDHARVSIEMDVLKLRLKAREIMP